MKAKELFQGGMFLITVFLVILSIVATSLQDHTVYALEQEFSESIEFLDSDDNNDPKNLKTRSRFPLLVLTELSQKSFRYHGNLKNFILLSSLFSRAPPLAV